MFQVSQAQLFMFHLKLGHHGMLRSPIPRVAIPFPENGIATP